jgi:alkanesulfonate monooxygenase SsuD/methylene tetrahydromethanopterin reductase-like flavin-dependent oxidoreductase (luciferase family)
MEFGVLFTSHPNPQEEPYPHRDVHARTTDEIVEAERLGYDTAWIAEQPFAERVIPAFCPPARQVAAAE